MLRLLNVQTKKNCNFLAEIYATAVSKNAINFEISLMLMINEDEAECLLISFQNIEMLLKLSY